MAKSITPPKPGDPKYGKGIGFNELADGASYTILVLEADATEAVIWTKPDGDYGFDPNDPMRGLGGQRIAGVIVGYADGSVETLDAVPGQIGPMFTIAGGD